MLPKTLKRPAMIIMSETEDSESETREDADARADGRALKRIKDSPQRQANIVIEVPVWVPRKDRKRPGILNEVTTIAGAATCRKTTSIISLRMPTQQPCKPQRFGVPETSPKLSRVGEEETATFIHQSPPPRLLDKEHRYDIQGRKRDQSHESAGEHSHELDMDDAYGNRRKSWDVDGIQLSELSPGSAIESDDDGNNKHNGSNSNTNNGLSQRNEGLSSPRESRSSSSHVVSTSTQTPPAPFFKRQLSSALPVDDKVQKWMDQAVWFDPQLQRLRYAHPTPAEILGDRHHQILREAYEVHKNRLDQLADEDYEFIAVIAGVTDSAARSWFKEQKLLINNTPPPHTPSDDCSIVTSTDTISTTTKSARDGDLGVIIRKFLPKNHRVVQTRNCSRLVVPFNTERCKVCRKRKTQEECVFRGFRYFYIKSRADSDDEKKFIYGPDFVSDTSKDQPLRFSKLEIDDKEALYILSFVHDLTRSYLEREIKYITGNSSTTDAEAGNREGYVRRPCDDRLYCENCNGSIVGGCTQWRAHHAEQFVPCGMFHTSTLKRYLQDLDARTPELPAELVAAAKSAIVQPAEAVRTQAILRKKKYRIAPKANAYEISQDEFQMHLRQGVVLVLTGVNVQLKQDWTPAYLKQKFGASEVQIMDCVSQEHMSTTLNQYFDDFFYAKGNKSVWRMMEWPVEPFQDMMEDLFEDLMLALPIPKYTRPRGVFNLASYFPQGHVRLELSPKLYLAQGFSHGQTNYGSINLSCEMADAVYICTYTAAPKPTNPRGRVAKDSPTVIWEIFRAEDRALVQLFLEQHFVQNKMPKKITDPFTYHTLYLSPALQQNLYNQTGVRPYRVEQSLGEAIVIPAGCLRQARYIHGSILVGVDFVSPERFTETVRWSKELREFNLRKYRKRLPDTLMTQNVLLYSTLAML
ncbi:hypothetical protein BGZ51_005770 [Haplosporangium sp. Z 767]|nr:hypothetical protein BGZ51_005770 [Haplosporangium sp. Z 767]